MVPVASIAAAPRRGKGGEDRALTLLMLAPAIAYILAFFAYPLGVTFLTSLETDAGVGPTLAQYQTILTSEKYLGTVWLTTGLAVGTTIFSVLLAVPLALILRQKMRGHRFIRLLILTPLMVLALISALGLLIIWDKHGWLNKLFSLLVPGGGPLSIDYTVPGLLLFYTWLYAPYTILTTLSAIEGLDTNVEEAARVAGASPWQLFRSVTLPLSWPGIRSGSILTFLLAFGAFNVPIIAGGDLRPLAVVIYTEASTFQHFARGSALAMVMAVVSLLVITVYLRLSSTPARRSRT
jgi:putative spermidine/putrescine transport system permease protein